MHNWLILQVFEDNSTGIICYKDDRGEIICEGFDEGPRLHPQYPSTPLPSRQVYLCHLSHSMFDT